MNSMFVIHLAKISSGNTCIFFKYINHCKELQNAMDWLGDAYGLIGLANSLSF